jgi:hypothetical protein
LIDECGVCGGDGIPEGQCDCDGNVLDECGVCGGTGIPEGFCDCDGSVLDAIGICDGDCVSDFNSNGICDVNDVVGCTYATASNFNPSATLDDGSCAFEGCTDDEACNFDGLAQQDDGSCEYPEEHYDCQGNCLGDSDGDGLCDAFDIEGCTDDAACNYDSEATDDDGSCWYAEMHYDCDGQCLSDEDGDGVCDELEVLGCTDDTACNYNPEATEDNDNCLSLDECGVCGGEGIAEGTCDCDGNVVDALGDCGGDCGGDFNGNGICDLEEEFGCTYLTATNYDSSATVDDGTCEFNLITDACSSDLNGDHAVSLSDLLILLTQFGTDCPE